MKKLCGFALFCFSFGLFLSCFLTGFAVKFIILVISILPASKDRIVAVLVVISFALSFLCSYLPGISALSEGTRTILLTVAISGAAAVLFPVRQEENEDDA